MKKMRLVFAALGAIGALSLRIDQKSLADAGDLPNNSISIDSEIPTDLPPFNGRKHHSLDEAAVFAWKQFIAVTWPAMPQDGTPGTRDTPDRARKYGQKGSTGQVVWETFRHKSEIFPGTGDPPGYDPSGANDFGYDATPKYIYNQGEIPPVSGPPPQIPPFDNLDEVDEIFLCSMHAGIANPTHHVFYQAKANRVLYNYIAKNKLFRQPFYQSGVLRANAVYNLSVDDPKDFRTPYLELPYSDPSHKKIGSMEIKSAWRRLNTNEQSPYYEDPKRYYTTQVRRYLFTADGLRYIDSPPREVWGLIALHVIQKTESSRTFIYTTFGHVDNIRAWNGVPVERPDGTTKPSYAFLDPFIPNLTIVDSHGPVNGGDATGQVVQADSGSYDISLPQLYTKNEPPFVHGIPQPVGINRRIFPIPPSVTKVNRQAHRVIREYDQDAVWQHYKLVNVQAQTLESFVDRQDLANLSDENKASFFLANIVVETNAPLQKFSGTLAPNDTTPGFEMSPSTDYYLDEQPPSYDPDHTVHVGHYKNKPVVNTYVREKGTGLRKLNIGGCLGCHGSQGQTFGGDFSVIVARGRVYTPEVSAEDTLAYIRRQNLRSDRMLFYPYQNNRAREQRK